MKLGDMLRRNARRHPNKVALICNGRKFTFAQLNARVNSIAKALLEIGLERGDRIAFVSESRFHFVEFFCTVAKSGMVLAPINPKSSSSELVHLLNNTEAKLIVTEQEYESALVPLLPSKQPKLLIINSPQGNYEDIISAHPSDEQEIDIREDELLFLPCTGGTTGMPKQVMRTHGNLKATMLNNLLAFNITPQDICLLATPPYWGTLIPWLIVSHFYMASTAVISQSFDFESVLESIEKERVTDVLLQSSYVTALLEYPELLKFNISSLRFIGLCGAPMSRERLKQAIRVFGNILVNLYASTELDLISFLPLDWDMVSGKEERRLSSCGTGGIPLAIEVKVVNEEGKDIVPGEVGEVIAKGDHLMKGYWKMPQATAEVIKNGYFFTGDLATVDEEGYIYLMGRKKDVIACGNNQVYCQEVEDVIYAHPSVKEVAVIGVLSKALEQEQEVKAVVVLKKGAVATEGEIIDLCSKGLPSYAVPTTVEFATKLPRNPAGKIVKSLLQ